MASPRTPRVVSPGRLHAGRSAILTVVGLLASQLALPYRAAAVVPLAWAGFESVRALRICGSDGSPVRSTVSNVVSLVLISLLVFIVALPFVVYDTAKAYQDCTNGANTAIARAECDSQVGNSLDSFVDGFRL